MSRSIARPASRADHLVTLTVMYSEAVPHEVTVVTVVRGDEALTRFLAALNEQSLPVPGYDLVIVDATRAGLSGIADVPRRFETQVVRVDPGVSHGAALNAGWHVARGAGVAFLSPDVVPVATWVEYFARSLRRGRRLISGRWLPTDASLPQAGPMSFRLWAVAREARLVASDQMGCRRADLEAVGGFDEDLIDPVICDTDVGIRLVESGVDPFFDSWLACNYDIEPVGLSTMIAARAAGADAVRMLADRPGARARLLSAGVIRRGAQPRVLLALVGLLLMRKDRRTVLLVAPWWHLRTCVAPLAAGRRRRRFVLAGAFGFDMYDAVTNLIARLSSSTRR